MKRRFFIFTVLAIVLPWFFQPGYLFFTDLSWGPYIPIEWDSHHAFLQTVTRILSWVIPSSWLQKLYLSAVLWLILAGGWKLGHSAWQWVTHKIDERWLIPISLFALFNPFVYDRALYGQFSILTGYACLLFFVAFLTEFIRVHQPRDAKFAFLFFGFALMSSPHFFFLLFPWVLLGGIWILKNGKEVSWKEVVRQAIPVFVFLLVANATWLYGLWRGSYLTEFVSTEVQQQELVGFQTSGETDLDALTNVVLMSGFWGKDQFRYADLTRLDGWERSFLVLLPLLMLGCWYGVWARSRRYLAWTVGLILLYLISVFFALGLRVGPLAPVVQWFYDFVPMYRGMREPQKWVAAFIPVYLWFLTWGTRVFVSTPFVQRNRRVVLWLLSLVVVAQVPSLLFGFGRQAVPIQYPQDWAEMEQVLIDRSGTGKCEARVLFLPWHLYLDFPWTPQVIVNPARNFFSCPLVFGMNMELTGVDDTLRMDEEHNRIAEWIKSEGSIPITSATDVRYILLSKSVDWLSYDWLDHLQGATLVHETDGFRLYEYQP